MTSLGIRPIVCFGADRLNHHHDYYLVISKFVPTIFERNAIRKIKSLFSTKGIVFLDIDKGDLLFTPIILLRGIWGGKGLALSVRTEYLLENDRSVYDVIVRKGRRVWFQAQIKKALFRSISQFSKTEILSIHKRNPQRKNLAKYVSDFIDDLQLWDLKYLDINEKKPNELQTMKFDKKIKILVVGRVYEHKASKELVDFLSSNTRYNFLFAGSFTDSFCEKVKRFSNINIINRFISNEEIIYLMKYADIVYCYYKSNRPSGFFGRAIQLEKPVIVRKGGYLDAAHSNYEKLVKVTTLFDLKKISIEKYIGEPTKTAYEQSEKQDDSQKLKEYLKAIVS